LENLCVDRRIIVRQIFRKQEKGMDWIDLAEERERCRALVNMVMNFWVP
jgi:hypothetical protein